MAERARGLLRDVLLPAEHGAWAFLGEPILLGLLVAPSGAGALVALAAIGAFLARRPLRFVVGDRRKGRRYPRTAIAGRALALAALVAALTLAAAAALSRGSVLIAVALALPFAALALAFDLGQRPREAAAEIAATLALGASAAAIAFAAGWPAAPALALWAIVACRAAPAVLYVRARLRLDRGEPAGIAFALGGHVLAIAAIAWLSARGLAPWLAAAAMTLLLIRAALGLSPARPRWTTMQLGLSEIAFGLVTIGVTAAGLR